MQFSRASVTGKSGCPPTRAPNDDFENPMSVSYPTFVSLHVASDLHLGGTPAGRQIFNQGEAFAAFVEVIRKKPKGEAHGIVLNGDLVDFLAEPNATYFDATGASAKVDRIIRDPAFVPFSDVPRKFVQTKDRYLAITLGNHDLELSLPAVPHQLLQELSAGDDAARGRITLAFDHEGYRARVWNAEVLCVHGNEVDPWNLTDYEDASTGRPRRLSQLAGPKVVAERRVQACHRCNERHQETIRVRRLAQARGSGRRADVAGTRSHASDQDRQRDSVDPPVGMGQHSARIRLSWRTGRWRRTSWIRWPLGRCVQVVGKMLDDTFAGLVFANEPSADVAELLRVTEDRLARGVAAGTDRCDFEAGIPGPWFSRVEPDYLEGTC